MSSNTEFDWLVAKICDTEILNNRFQIFRVQYSCAAPNVIKSLELTER